MDQSDLTKNVKGLINEKWHVEVEMELNHKVTVHKLKCLDEQVLKASFDERLSRDIQKFNLK
ncbi:hypothetical protein ACHAXS_001720 [Conticribra weissflogii]